MYSLVSKIGLLLALPIGLSSPSRLRLRTVYLRPRSSYVGAVETNSNETTFEADSHADTTCLGRGTLKIFDYDTPVNVQGYDPALGSKEYRIISGVLGYIHPHTGTKYHLVVHQAVHVPELQHNLLCPM